ncbi:hypothetical protein FBUS_08450 [Fasciolopsis buskii]|uniref:Uncharacterized protein n=1 Tax=Fasciolopsis buskii TaxID=27845 RepID=A0A8E0RUY4_9TREM|nr:hypothetical protein FBUS_08450 [Fasciolopsis buski]
MPRNRLQPRRFDLTDANPEIALKRSLIEQTSIRKKKIEIEVAESNDQNHHASDQGPFKEKPKRLTTHHTEGHSTTVRQQHASTEVGLPWLIKFVLDTKV